MFPVTPALRCGYLGLLAAVLAAPIAALVAAPAAARCIPVAQGPGIPAAPGSLAGPVPVAEKPPQANRGPKLPQATVEITFLGHSSFLIRTHENIAAITDYNGYNRAPFAPDIVTMNRAHTSHHTDVIEPGVKHVLRGWAENGKIPRHNLILRDMRVTNVPTNIRDYVGDSGTAGNSIFIFESAGLCVVHLGHLHHTLRPGHAGRVGTVDIMLVPIDDGMTMSHQGVAKVIDDLDPVVVIPMHYGFRGDTLSRFTQLMVARKYAVRVLDSASVRFAKATLPGKTFLVLRGGQY